MGRDEGNKMMRMYWPQNNPVFQQYSGAYIPTFLAQTAYTQKTFPRKRGASFLSSRTQTFMCLMTHTMKIKRAALEKYYADMAEGGFSRGVSARTLQGMLEGVMAC
jgi:hypothetical protein